MVRDAWQIQVEVVVAFLIKFGAHVNLLFRVWALILWAQANGLSSNYFLVSTPPPAPLPLVFLTFSTVAFTLA